MQHPVLIAGGGAAGLMTALLLAQQGVDSLVVEARQTPYDIPRAHALNPRSLEICHALGLDLARMQREAAPRSEAGQVFFLPRLFGPVLGSLPYERQDDAASAFTPFPLINLPQTEFETLLFEAVATEPRVELRRGWRWTGMNVGPSGVISSVDTPAGATNISSRYLIGCDGAGSAVRSTLGIGMAGDPAVLSCVSIIFQADLRGRLEGRRGILYWATDPEAPGTFLAYHLDRLWSFVQMHPPGPIDMGRYSVDACRRMVLEAAGGEIPDLEIIKAVPWTMTSQVADNYGRGPVFLVGDAAHRFPPTGGLGLNTGIQDAHNLAWKLGAVERGHATPELLETYESERRPVAMRNAEQSLVNAQRISALRELSCGAAIWRDPVAFEAWQTQGGRAERIRQAVELQREHFDSFGLQLGFIYPPGVGEVAVSDYRPSAEVGHRLPHAWLRDDGRRDSTLDLIDPIRFTAFGPGEALIDLEGQALSLVALDDARIPSSWRDLLMLAPGACLLARPDGHVAYRGPAKGVAGALERLLRPASVAA